MRRIKILVGLFVGFLISFGFAVGNTFNVSFAESVVLMREEKIYCEVTLQDHFDDDRVLVVLDKYISEINKPYSSDFFGVSEIESVEDLTYVTGNIEEKKYLNREEFRQILRLKLTEPSKENVLNVIEKVQKIDGVLSAEPNFIREVSLDATSNDAELSSQWSMTGNAAYNAQIARAWDITTGSDTVYVGVIDSGIAVHEDLEANVDRNKGRDFYNENNITSDDPTGHGTHVAGIIGAIGDNGKGVAGVNWHVKLVPLQTVYWDVGEGKHLYKLEDVTQAINWAKNNDISILNISLGWVDAWTTTARSAIKNYNGLIVCSAGNGEENLSGVYVGIDVDNKAYYPSEYSDEANTAYSGFSDRIISVGSLMSSGAKATSSNYGAKTVTLFAPGVNILNTVPADECEDGANGCYHYKGGTSMAAPHVAGVAALLLSIDSTLTAAQLKDIICENVDGREELVGKCVTGGRLNALKAVASVAFERDSTGAVITGLNFTPSGSLTIPDEIDGIQITGIGDQVFMDCDELTEISFPPYGALTDIGDYAFADCDQLTTLWFSNSVRRIGNSAFLLCPLLETFTMSNNIEEIGEYAFLHCESIGRVDFNSDQLETIGEGAFSCCESLTDVTFESNSILSTIGDNAFEDCVALTTISIPSTVTSMGAGVFEGCTSLTSVTLPFVGESATSTNCYLGYLFGAPNYSTQAQYIPQGLATVTVTGGTSIGNYAFYGCSGLTRVFMPTTVSLIGTSAFEGCTKLSMVTIPESVTMISNRVFYGCSGMSSITVNATSLHVGTEAFAYSGLYSIAFPNVVVTIGDRAFYNCTRLQGVTIHIMMSGLGEQTFYGCGALYHVEIFYTTAEFDPNVFYGASPSEIIWDNASGGYYRSENNCLIRRSDNALVMGGRISIIPTSVTSIADEAFIGRWLVAISIPTSVTSIGSRVFKDCSGLTALNYSGTMAEWAQIQKAADWNEGSSITSVVCSDGSISV